MQIKGDRTPAVTIGVPGLLRLFQEICTPINSNYPINTANCWFDVKGRLGGKGNFNARILKALNC